MRILYVHRGVEGNDGWGRSFFLAAGMVNLGHEVTFMTIKKKNGLKIEEKIIEGVAVICFPEILPNKLKSSGFGLFSLFYKIFFSLTNKFDLVITDCGHRPSAIPAFVNQYLWGSTHISEWWDLYGDGGYYKEKPLYFKVFYGNFEKWFEVKSKKLSDGVIVLSSWMYRKAKEIGLEKVAVVQGGAATSKLQFLELSKKAKDEKLVVAYLGMAETELELLKPVFEAFSDPIIKERVEFWGFGKHIPPLKMKEYGLDGILVEKGWIDYLKEIGPLSEVDVFLMVRKVNENALAGWPNKLGDYLAIGRPVIINPYGDLNEFVKANSGGFILVDFQKESIVESIKDLLAGKYNLQEMGLRNRILAESISWESKSLELLKFYDQVKESR